MIVKRTRAAAGLATAFALLAVTAPSGPASLVTSSGAVDVVLPAEDEVAPATVTNGGIAYEPREEVSVEVPGVEQGDLAAASRTVVTRMAELEAGDISDRALGSYAFAAQAMAKADPDCQITWSLLAAIGAIESAHGTKDGARLRDSGVAAPAIRGAALDGRGAQAKVKDTDEGRFDEDRRWDRAVGPMQLLPATWSYVGVDGDGNGKRTPDDLDDAALAVGVYLCAAAGEAGEKAGAKAAKLTSEEAGALGMKKALAWFNPSPAYSVLARRLDRDYLKAYGVTPYSAAPDATSLQAISLVAPMAPSLSPDRAVLAARTAKAAKPVKPAKPAKGAKGADDAGRDPVAKGPDNGANPDPDPTPGSPASPEPTAPGTPVVTPEPPVDLPADTETDPGTDVDPDTDEGTDTDVDVDPETPDPETPVEPEPTPTPVATFTGVLVEVDGIFSIDGVEITGLDPVELAPYVGQTVVVTYDPDSITPQ